MSRPRHWSYRGEGRRKAIFQRDGYRCQIRLEGCLGTATEIDHIIRKEWGGGDQPDNLRAACKWCNNRLNNPAVRRRFFSGTQRRIAPLRNLPPRRTNDAVVADYTRREDDDGRSPR
jgi:5-methylcytosine-specific restriction endonuclease McrA